MRNSVKDRNLYKGRITPLSELRNAKVVWRVKGLLRDKRSSSVSEV